MSAPLTARLVFCNKSDSNLEIIFFWIFEKMVWCSVTTSCPKLHWQWSSNHRRAVSQANPGGAATSWSRIISSDILGPEDKDGEHSDYQADCNHGVVGDESVVTGDRKFKS